MFIDKATIKVTAGTGGNGAISFHREKFVAAGGPDGGDGGRGGNIVLQGCQSINTLIDFKYKRKFIAQNGQNGGTNRCFGKSAPDLVIKVPVGTVVKNAESGQVMADIVDFGGQRSQAGDCKLSLHNPDPGAGRCEGGRGEILCYGGYPGPD